MTHQFYKRKWKSHKDDDIPGHYEYAPTWDDTVVHWLGFSNPINECDCVNGEGYEYGDEATWTENYLDGCCWVTEDESYCYSLDGSGYSISPTRTPWASWWRPTKAYRPVVIGYTPRWNIAQKWCVYWNFLEGVIELNEYNILDGTNWHDTFHGPCECGAWHSLPDVQKENPQ